MVPWRQRKVAFREVVSSEGNLIQYDIANSNANVPLSRPSPFGLQMVGLIGKLNLVWPKPDLNVHSISEPKLWKERNLLAF